MRKTDVESAKALAALDLIVRECGKHTEKDGEFRMDCPFCGAAGDFVVVKSRYSIGGGCSSCGVPFHMKLKG